VGIIITEAEFIVNPAENFITKDLSKLLISLWIIWVHLVENETAYPIRIRS